MGFLDRGGSCGYLTGNSASALGWDDLAGGVLAGLIAAVIAWAISCALRWKRNRDHFGSLAGLYRVNEKSPSERAEGTVVISGSGPTLDFVWRFEDGSEARGKIAMNEQSRVTGSGSYEHVRDGKRGWGDVSVQVGPRDQDAVRPLVDGRYTSQTTRESIASAWVWELEGDVPRGSGFDSAE